MFFDVAHFYENEELLHRECLRTIKKKYTLYQVYLTGDKVI